MCNRKIIFLCEAVKSRRSDMPKEKETQREFNFRIVRQFPKVFRADENVLFCLLCDCNVPTKKLFGVKQHIETSKHQTLVTSFQNSTPEVDPFHMDMCQAFLEANIPLHKVSHPSIVKFLEKYTKKSVPSVSTLRNKYVDTIYEKTMADLREKVGNKCIWVSLDETTDSEQRLIGNFVFGLMEDVDEASAERGKCYLLNVGVLKSSDATSISTFFVDSLLALWPEGKIYIRDER